MQRNTHRGIRKHCLARINVDCASRITQRCGAGIDLVIGTALRCARVYEYRLMIGAADPIVAVGVLTA